MIEGVHRFRGEAFGRYKGLFQRLSAAGQKPHTLFITCADSRVLAELITQSQPGDLFVVKNIGNIVPPAVPGGGACSSTGAAIEFAVDILGVEDVVICGHSQCGAIAALMGKEIDPALGHLREWISLAEPVRQLIEEKYQHLDSEEARVRAAESENVLFSLERLQTYPGVARRLEEQKIRLHAWFFKIATGELFAYDPEEKQFLPMRPKEG